MSRWSLDDDDRFSDELSLNATCDDCGMDFSRAYDDQGAYCDGCSDRRDAHTSALELRLASDGQSAKVSIDTPVVVDVAIVPAHPEAPLGPVLEIALEWSPAWDAIDPPVPAAGTPTPRAISIFSRLPTLSAVAASRAHKPIPKQPPARRRKSA